MHTGHTVVRGTGKYNRKTVSYTSIILIPCRSLKKAALHHRGFREMGPGFPGSEGEPVNQGFDIFFWIQLSAFGASGNIILSSLV